MARIKKAAAMLTAAEAARQWALRNPDAAAGYIDKATGFIDKRTKGKYHKQLDGLSQTVRKNLTGTQTVSGSTVTDTPPAPTESTRPFPDLRA